MQNDTNLKNKTHNDKLISQKEACSSCHFANQVFRFHVVYVWLIPIEQKPPSTIPKNYNYNIFTFCSTNHYTSSHEQYRQPKVFCCK